MKIALLTIHYAYNYGAMLQAYALQEYINEQGACCEIIDYVGKRQSEEYKLFHLNKSLVGMMRNVRNLFTLRKQIARKKAFDRFKSGHLKLSEHATIHADVERLLESYDICLIGSDQTWNIHLNAFDPVYLLPFNTKAVKAAYAPSMGDNLTKFTEEELQHIASHIKEFKYISVREEKAQKVLSPYIDKPIATVVDPTLLLCRNEWDAVEKNSASNASTSGKYILFYTVKSDKSVVDYCKHLATETGLEVVCLHPQNQFEIGCQFKRNISIGPAEFISYIKNAELVCTTSFHATVFSVLYHKRLLCPTKNSRVLNLLEHTGLNGCAVDLCNPKYGTENMEWETVDDKLQEMRTNSADYIKQFLGV